jgi:putative iron-regulated protein
MTPSLVPSVDAGPAPAARSPRAASRLGAGLAALMALCCAGFGAQAGAEPRKVVETYGAIGEAAFGDAHAAARDLKAAVASFLAAPDARSLEAARAAWKAARPWYMHTEAFRFGNKVVDDWEGRVNSWPLDEGLIDYVDVAKYGEESDENALFRANVIANLKLRIGKTQVDATRITKALLAEKLHQAAGVEANVATGYHAVEFLLWGQDLNGTGPGAGARPATDYDLKACTNGHCDRRRAYLQTVTDLLVDDLAEMAASWRPGGAARRDLLKKTPEAGLATILTGIGSLSYGELAGERMKLGVLLHDPEEEQDCFSDNTHNAHYGDQVGMIAVYRGSYKRRDGTTLTGPSLADLVHEKAPEEAAVLDRAMDTALGKLDAIRVKAESGEMAYDQMLASGNEVGNRLILDAVDALVAQTRGVEAIVAKLGLKIEVEGSKSLDSPEAVTQK